MLLGILLVPALPFVFLINPGLQERVQERTEEKEKAEQAARDREQRAELDGRHHRLARRSTRRWWRSANRNRRWITSSWARGKKKDNSLTKAARMIRMKWADRQRYNGTARRGSTARA